MKKEVEAKDLSLFRTILLLLVPAVGSTYAFMIFRFRSIFYSQVLEAWNVDNTQLGVIFTVYGVVSFFVFFFGGLIADKFRIKYLIPLSVVLLSASIVLLGQKTSYVMLIVNFGLQAFFGNAIFWGCRFKIIRLMSKKPEDYPKLLGFGTVATILVELIITSCISAMMAKGIVFNNCVKIVGCAGFVLAAVLYLMIPYFKGEFAEKKEDEPGKKKGFNMDAVRYCLKSPAVWITSFMSFFVYSIYGYSYVFNEMMSYAGMSVAAITIVANIRTYVVGWMADPVAGMIQSKQKTGLKYTLLSGLVSVVCCVLILTCGIKSTLVTVTVVATLIMAFFSTSANGLCTNIMSEFDVPAEYFGTATGIVSTIMFIPDIAYPIPFGNIMDGRGESAYVVFAILFLIFGLGMIAVSLWGRKEKKKHTV